MLRRHVLTLVYYADFVGDIVGDHVGLSPICGV